MEKLKKAVFTFFDRNLIPEKNFFRYKGERFIRVQNGIWMMKYDSLYRDFPPDDYSILAYVPFVDMVCKHYGIAYSEISRYLKEWINEQMKKKL